MDTSTELLQVILLQSPGRLCCVGRTTVDYSASARLRTSQPAANPAELLELRMKWTGPLCCSDGYAQLKAWLEGHYQWDYLPIL